MDIKDYIHEYRMLQKQKKKVRVADFCRERSLDYYEMVNALKQEKFEAEYGQEEPATVGDLVITGLHKYCECNMSFRYKWDALVNYIRYVLHEDPWSGTVFIFMNRRHTQLRVFYYERGGFVISEKKLDKGYKFLTPVFDEKKKTYAISWADFVSLLEDKQLRRLYLREVA